ncbi:TetR family transcriptional regulator C-terminal domain-containing protein [Novosphingobium sp.]|uniref:TetR/AcrR family transcriptional regulator n=1 Tax=Novosphingobium sp. TaxID=1874826 RepID=UPI001E0E50D9|nr:TetR family transcriptional regulator C-terminal domain-containing protein [Novosphingobium sp.]MBX9665654.1 TetR family transcriptional regulator C-terminal domain-containing protein [Novosphingobium sp.]
MASPAPELPGAPRRRRAPPLVRRADLVAATLSCLARLGAKGTTGREICRQAGVSHGLLRHYFRNPDNLLLETYEQLCEDMLAQLEAAALPYADDPREALHRYFVAVFSDDWAGPDIIGAWMVFWQQARSRADFAVVSDSFNLRQRALLERLVAVLPARADALPMADAIALLSAVLDGLWIEYYLSDERTPRERCIALCDAAVRRLFGA